MRLILRPNGQSDHLNPQLTWSRQEILTRLDVPVQDVVGVALCKSPQDSPHVTGNLHAPRIIIQQPGLFQLQPAQQRRISMRRITHQLGSQCSRS